MTIILFDLSKMRLVKNAVFYLAKYPLNHLFSLQTDSNGLESYEYVMKIVPTTYEDISGNSLIAYQYTYAFRR